MKMLDKLSGLFDGIGCEKEIKDIKANIRGMRKIVDDEMNKIYEEQLKEQIKEEDLKSENFITKMKVNAIKAGIAAGTTLAPRSYAVVEKKLLEFLNDPESELYKQTNKLEENINTMTTDVTKQIQDMVKEGTSLMFDEDEAPFYKEEELKKKTDKKGNRIYKEYSYSSKPVSVSFLAQSQILCDG